MNLRIIACLVLWLLAPFAFAQSALAQTPALRVDLPNVAYTMGDLMPMHVTIALPNGHSLDTDSLPLAGRMRPWLDLRSVEYTEHGQTLEISLVWQLFATVEVAQSLKTPEIQLKTKGNKPVVITIPPQAFYYAPSFPFPLPEIKRAQNLPPFLFDTHTPKIAMILSLSLGILALFIWAWLKDLLPFLPFKPGPMTQLARQLNRERPSQLLPRHLKSIHAALKQSAGMTLYPNTLQQLFDKASYLSAEKDAITGFFNASWAQFYGHDYFASHEPNEVSLDVNTCLAWINRTAIAERLCLRLQRKALAKPLFKFFAKSA